MKKIDKLILRIYSIAIMAFIAKYWYTSGSILDGSIFKMALALVFTSCVANVINPSWIGVPKKDKDKNKDNDKV